MNAGSRRDARRIEVERHRCRCATYARIRAAIHLAAKIAPGGGDENAKAE